MTSRGVRTGSFHKSKLICLKLRNGGEILLLVLFLLGEKVLGPHRGWTTLGSVGFTAGTRTFDCLWEEKQTDFTGGETSLTVLMNLC